VRRTGSDITLVGSGYSTLLCERAAQQLAAEGISAEVVDLRVLNPLHADVVRESAARTGRLCAVDGSWRTAGIAAEIVALVCESVQLKSRPIRVTLPDAPAPTSKPLEASYYPDEAAVAAAARRALRDN